MVEGTDRDTVEDSEEGVVPWQALVKLPGLQKSILMDIQYVVGPIKDRAAVALRL